MLGPRGGKKTSQAKQTCRGVHRDSFDFSFRKTPQRGLLWSAQSHWSHCFHGLHTSFGVGNSGLRAWLQSRSKQKRVSLRKLKTKNKHTNKNLAWCFSLFRRICLCSSLFYNGVVLWVFDICMQCIMIIPTSISSLQLLPGPPSMFPSTSYLFFKNDTASVHSLAL